MTQILCNTTKPLCPYLPLSFSLVLFLPQPSSPSLSSSIFLSLPLSSSLVLSLPQPSSLFLSSFHFLLIPLSSSPFLWDESNFKCWALTNVSFWFAGTALQYHSGFLPPPPLPSPLFFSIPISSYIFLFFSLSLPLSSSEFLTLYFSPSSCLLLTLWYGILKQQN